jgi:hypothetical protein
MIRMRNEWGIPSLRTERLATLLSTCTYVGGSVTDPTRSLFVWRTAALSKARGCVLAFYVWDEKLEQLWRRPQHYTELFLRHEIAAVIEPDYSLWTDDALAVQVFNVYRTRWLGRYWQDAGLLVIPSLNWSDERSSSFCFAGIPVGAPVVAVECRTAGQTDEDRRRFLAGLTEGVKQVQPRHVIVYGGKEHRYWLAPYLPQGPRYTLLESWPTARGRVRQQAAQKNQLHLFPVGGKRWVDEAVAVMDAA